MQVRERLFLFVIFFGGMLLSVGTVGTASAQTNLAYDMVGTTSQNLTSFTNSAPAFGSLGDGFGKYQVGVSGSIPFAIVDDSGGAYPPDTLGIIDSSTNTDEFFGVTDTENGDNSGDVTATWVFDISGNSGSPLSLSINMGAMGDFEGSDMFVWRYSIDGGAMQPAFTLVADEATSQTYTLAGGYSDTLDDPMTVSETGTVLSNNLQTITTTLAGVGNTLTLELVGQTNGGSEAFAFQDIVISEGSITPAVQINELGVSDTGTDAEFFELIGSAGTSLDGVYLVLLDAATGSQTPGYLRGIFDLSGNAIQSDGFFVGTSPEADTTYSGITSDFALSNNNFTNAAMTYLLVYAPGGFTVPADNDLDTDDDGTLDTVPWDSVIDSVALTEGGTGEVFYNGASVVGPDGSYLPPGAYRCPDDGTFDAGNILSFNPENGTPDASNAPLCGSAPSDTKIHAIQGSGNSVTDTSTAFTVEAVVVADLQESGELDGFFIQEEDADVDGDPTTSEGIFVYCGSSGGNCPDVTLGDVVSVTGQASDYFDMSQLNPSSSSDVTVVSSGNPLPTAATVSFPVPAATGGVDYLERFEGMYVTVDTPMAITEYYNYDRYGEMLLWTDGSVTAGSSVRPYQFTATNAPDATGFSNYLDTFALQTVTLDDSSTEQNPATLPYPRPGFGATNSFRGGDVVTGLDGVLNYSFSKWRIQNFDRSADVEVDNDASITFNALNPRPTTPPALASGNMRVASFNVLNYFNGDGMGGGFPTPRGADTAAEFQRQRDKIIEAVCLLDADIVGVNEVENDYTDGNLSAIADLVAGLNNSATCGSRVYDYVDPEQNLGSDAIAVGFLYDTTAVRITPGTTPAFLSDSASFITPPVFEGNSTNRVPLAASFTDLTTREQLTVVVNHFKSKGGSGSGANADQGDGQGNWNARRTQAAQAIVTWMGNQPTGTQDDDVLIIGDLNSYDEEDPITTLESNGYTDLIDAYQGNDAYGYVFDGQWGYLDYALSNATLTSQVVGAAEWHINADEPRALDYDTTYNPAAWYENNQYRASDHDPVIVSLNLNDILPDVVDVQTRGTLLAGTVVSNAITNAGVRFSAPVNDDAGLTSDGVGDTVTNPANYYLVYQGNDGVLDTVPGAAYCTAPTPTNDDMDISIDGVTYTATPTPMATLEFNGGTPLAEGDYVLVICGSTSVVGLNGNPINDGSDAVFNFTVQYPITQPPTNPGGDGGSGSGDTASRGGDDVIIGANGEPLPVQQLPSTGETPLWRTLLPGVAAALMVIGGGVLVWSRRRRA